MTLEGLMNAMMSRITAALLVLWALAVPAAPHASTQPAATLYNRAMVRERTVRDAGDRAGVRQLRAAVASYERVVRRHPASAYCDNALWQAANLALIAYERSGDVADRQHALRLLSQLQRGYPSSSLRSRIPPLLADLEAVTRSAPAARTVVVPAAAEAAPVATSGTAPVRANAPPPGLVTIREVRRAFVAEGIRVTVELDGEALFTQERLDNPPRLFFDLKRTRAAGTLQDTTIRYGDGAVRLIRLGRRPENTTRVVFDLTGVDGYSVFTLYNPFRVIVDFRTTAPAGTITGAAATTGAVAAPVPLAPPSRELRLEAKAVSVPEVAPPPVITAGPIAPVPSAPSVNLNGQFSLARQLGLGISRVVIDAGHGGHDPGARANGLNEAELVLDIAGRVRALLEKVPSMEVRMTRDSDVYVPLEQRTAIANREGADLFLSIHANASRNSRARGVETYFLNFASNPEAEAVAARENSTSGRTMRSLPDIVRAIALNNKIDESRDFADTVQKSMVRKLSARNAHLRDLGVKQAPFVVLIGAGMPSVLAEISFLTNKQDAQLLKTPAYRQQIAEALYDAVLRYQGSLKKMRSVASRE
ncbi:MAG TPA: N-acetylmuramoyl-L-alanine amidase [Vicinamibacterales bacterium]|nr:N-acetylmuramoyl-L-alanine amidase [Vicinamibacterales bacterium]